ncbi:TPA: hypothetical protein ACT9AU_001890 [Legionella pneumophila]|nr:hypothetical protein [Legionella pneumophila]HDO7873624.1 hypothetical protein [Legionella pneumophila]HDO7940523.1 hypothetical protein [Legionella pneumophila]HDO8157867.1 hypothetical protein [Legionella pneumophila]HDO9866998.1 hypothetical protein [Legionella pneumophila]
MKDQNIFNSYNGIPQLKNSVHKNYLFINQFVESQKNIRKFLLKSNLISSIGVQVDDALEPKKGLQELRTEIIEAAFQKITELAKEQGIIIHRDKMPGTKFEFIDLMRVLEPRIHHITKTTTNDYFKRMSIKFRRGNKTAKCSEMTKLKTIIHLN